MQFTTCEVCLVDVDISKLLATEMANRQPIASRPDNPTRDVVHLSSSPGEIRTYCGDVNGKLHVP